MYTLRVPSDISTHACRQFSLPTSSLHLLLSTWAEKGIGYTIQSLPSCHMECAEVVTGDPWNRMVITILPLKLTSLSLYI